MKATKIFAGLSAAAFAASMMSMVSVSAAEEAAAQGSTTVTVDEDYVGEEVLTVDDLLKDQDVADVVAIEFYADEEDKEFQITYNGKEAKGQDEVTGEDIYEVTTDPANTIRIEAEDIYWENYYFAIRYTSDTVGDEINVNWDVLVDGEVTETPSSSVTDSSSEDDTDTTEGSVVMEFGEGIAHLRPFSFTYDLIEEEHNYQSATITLEGLNANDDTKPAYWNSECSLVVEVADADGNTFYCVIAGEDYNDAITFGEGDDAVTIEPEDFIRTDEDGNVTFVAPYGEGYNIFIYANDFDEPEEAANTAYSMVVDIEFAYSDSNDSSSSSTVDSSSNPSSSTPSSSVADSSSTPDSSSAASSSSTSSTTSNPAAANNGTADKNPSTGAAALGALGVVLAGAAMVVSKKQD